MPILRIPLYIAALVSLAILAAGGWLLWDWWQGDLVRAPDGALVRVRHDWPLWTAAALLGWSFLGRFVTPLLLAGADRRPTKAERTGGRMIETAQGSRLYVEEDGRPGAQTLIFTHGWGMDSTYWRYARQDLTGRFRVVTWDLPGLGRSRLAEPDNIALETFAADLEQLITDAGGRKPILVGHSIGGMTIQTLLRDRPEVQNRLGGVVLLNTTFTNPLTTMALSRLWLALQRPVLEPMARLTILLNPLAWAMQWQSYLSGSTHVALRLGFGKYVTRSQLEHAALLGTRNSPAVQMRGDIAMFHWDATGALDRVWNPVLVVGGDVDIVTKPQASRALAAGEGRRLELVEGANHMGPMERYEVYDKLIADFALNVREAVDADRRSEAPETNGVDPRPWGEDLGRGW